MFDQKQHYRSRRKTHNAYASILKQKNKPYNDLLICRSLKQQSHLARKQRETAVHHLCYLTKKCYLFAKVSSRYYNKKRLTVKTVNHGLIHPLITVKIRSQIRHCFTKKGWPSFSRRVRHFGFHHGGIIFNQSEHPQIG